MSTEYVAGILVGLLVAVLVVLLVRKFIRKEGRPKYDERQKLKQAEVGRNAFFLLLICNAVYALFAMFPFMERVDTQSGIFACIFISVTYYACECIWKEAYFGIGQKQRRWRILFLFLGLFNITMGVRDSGTLINLLVGAMCIIVVLVASIKQRINSKAEALEDAAEARASEAAESHASDGARASEAAESHASDGARASEAAESHASDEAE